MFRALFAALCCFPLITLAADTAAIDAVFQPSAPLKLQLELSPDDWKAVAEAEPLGLGPDGKRCDLFEAPQLDDRFEWRPAGTVNVTVTSGARSLKFANVGLKKKSYCGSFDKKKPSLSLDLDKYAENNKQLAKDALGFTALSLGNLAQDHDLFRQCAAYDVFAKLGVMVPRCTLARVSRKSGDKEVFIGVYVVLEAVKKEFFSRRDLKRLSVYEFERFDDFVQTTIDTNQLQTKWADLPGDFQKAVTTLAGTPSGTDTATTLEQVFDLPGFVNFWAGEIALRHWDGFNSVNNNTYAFNAASAEQPRFVFIPHGLDQILNGVRNEYASENPKIYSRSLPAQLALRDPLVRFHLIRTLAGLGDVLDDADLSKRIDTLAATAKPLWDAEDSELGAPGALAKRVDAVKDAFEEGADDLRERFGDGLGVPPSGRARNVAFVSTDQCVVLKQDGLTIAPCSKEPEANWTFEPIALPAAHGFPAATLYRVRQGPKCLAITNGVQAQPCGEQTTDAQRFFFTAHGGDSMQVRAWTEPENKGCLQQTKKGLALGDCDGGDDNLISIRTYQPRCDAVRKDLREVTAQRKALKALKLFGANKAALRQLKDREKALKKKLDADKCDE